MERNYPKSPTNSEVLQLQCESDITVNRLRDIRERLRIIENKIENNENKHPEILEELRRRHLLLEKQAELAIQILGALESLIDDKLEIEKTELN